MHLGREKLIYNLESAYGGVLGRTPMTDYHDGLHLERSKGTRDQTSLHTIRTETNSDRPIKGISSTKKILETETG